MARGRAGRERGLMYSVGNTCVKAATTGALRGGRYRLLAESLPSVSVCVPVCLSGVALNDRNNINAADPGHDFRSRDFFGLKPSGNVRVHLKEGGYSDIIFRDLSTNSA